MKASSIAIVNDLITNNFQSNGDSYRHLSLLSNGVTKPLTSGLYVVLDILKWDPITNYVFYTANSVNASHVQHVYIIKAEEDENKREPYCITCTINQGNIPQTYFSASVSPDAKHLIIVNEGPSIPQTDIVEWNIVNSSKYDCRRSSFFHLSFNEFF